VLFHQSASQDLLNCDIATCSQNRANDGSRKGQADMLQVESINKSQNCGYGYKPLEDDGEIEYQ
jgi:hypothetical protein